MRKRGAEATEGHGPEQLSRPANREEADGEQSTGHQVGQQASSRAPSQALLAFQFRISDFRIPVRFSAVLRFLLKENLCKRWFVKLCNMFLILVVKDKGVRWLTSTNIMVEELNTVLEAFGRVMSNIVEPALGSSFVDMLINFNLEEDIN
nr:hypothetical protein Iba_chr02aCG20430 [Ipomoea batatas]